MIENVSLKISKNICSENKFYFIFAPPNGKKSSEKYKRE